MVECVQQGGALVSRDMARFWGRVLMEKKSFHKNELDNSPKGQILLSSSLGSPILHQGKLIGPLHEFTEE